MPLLVPFLTHCNAHPNVQLRVQAGITGQPRVNRPMCAWAACLAESTALLASHCATAGSGGSSRHLACRCCLPGVGGWAGQGFTPD